MPHVDLTQKIPDFNSSLASYQLCGPGQVCSGSSGASVFFLYFGELHLIPVFLLKFHLFSRESVGPRFINPAHRSSGAAMVGEGGPAASRAPAPSLSPTSGIREPTERGQASLSLLFWEVGCISNRPQANPEKFLCLFFFFLPRIKPLTCAYFLIVYPSE